jgi:hypothetical protein
VYPTFFSYIRKDLGFNVNAFDYETEHSGDRIYRYTNKNSEEIIEIHKEVYLGNNFSMSIKVDNIRTTSSDLTIKEFRAGTIMPFQHRLNVFTLVYRNSVATVNRTQINEYLIVESEGILIPLKIRIFNKMLTCSYQLNDNSYQSAFCNSKENPVVFDYSYVGSSEVLFYLYQRRKLNNDAL